MINILRARRHQGYRTHSYPLTQPTLPEAFRGRPAISGPCTGECTRCVGACPTGSVKKKNGIISIDMGLCLFCADCTHACPEEIISFTGEYRLASATREGLTVESGIENLAEALNKEAARLFGRSLKLRQVSAGGCNACEADTNVLNTLTYDLGRFGIQFVASPRHADGLLVTGPVSENMKLALEKTYAAVPPPKIVIATGACAISGGPYRGLPETHNGVDAILPVDLYIPGCPPSPWTILDGLLRLLGKITVQ